MNRKKSVKKLSKFLSYVLGRKPDEFGLVPDKHGFVKVKELVLAVREEKGWRHIRQALIEELIITYPKSSIEINGDKIRAVSGENLPEQIIARNLPKLLYSGITKKSYPSVAEKGISPTRYAQVICSIDKSMAERIEKRRDPSPILLIINVRQAKDSGVVFYNAGELLCFADFIPPGCFSGPPVPKQKLIIKKPEISSKEKKKNLPGSFFPKIKPDNNLPSYLKRKKGKEISWKRDKKRLRKEGRYKW